MEKLHFKTSSGIKSIVGKDLITDRYVAIFELVKNSYDAKASKVEVIFNTNAEPNNITIIDNGVGMSKVDLVDKWLHLAYSDKQEGSQNKDRPFVGSKGVGRFSCDNLGDQLSIYTKKKDEAEEHCLKVDWTDFEKSLSIPFGGVEVEYSSKRAPILDSYTKIVISGLRHNWDEHAIQKARKKLESLTNPFKKDSEFSIYCLLNSEENGAKDLVQTDIAEVLKDKSITIEAVVSEQITIQLFDRGRLIYRISKESESFFEDVKMNISINYLTTAAKQIFTRRMGIEPVRYGNIFIYKNSFRVNPYGEEAWDTFGLSLRKTQGYARYIGNREIIGYIDILDKSNHFKETSSRNSGFINNIYLEYLESFYMEMIHRPLEQYVHLVNWGQIKDTQTEIFFSDVDVSEAEKFKSSIIKKGNFKLDFFTEDANFEHNNPKKQLERVAQSLPDSDQKVIGDLIGKFGVLDRESKEKSNAIAQQDKTISGLKKQNANLLLNRNEASYAEQVSHHTLYMAENLEYSIKDLSALQKELDLEKQGKLNKIIQSIRRTELELKLFRNILIKSDIDMRSPQNINLYETASWFFNEKINTNQSLTVICNLIDKKSLGFWNVRCKVLDFVMALENFYQNAKDHGATFIDFQFDKNFLTVESNSTEIDENNLEKIFELGFTTKPNGTGIGMNQIKSFLRKIGFLIRVENIHNKVCFKISKEMGLK